VRNKSEGVPRGYDPLVAERRFYSSAREGEAGRPNGIGATVGREKAELFPLRGPQWGNQRADGSPILTPFTERCLQATLNFILAFVIRLAKGILKAMLVFNKKSQRCRIRLFWAL